MKKGNSWRPKNWPENPCDGCPQKVEDIYGLFCDLACGKHSAYINKEAGADAILEGLKDGAYRIEAYGYVDFPILASHLKCGSSAGRAGYIAFIPDEEEK